ncbi:MAG: diguanylate cyclase [Candidatus Poribacteria bacterium]|nr:diguanylate cyclase [Candidatus Poribacteria bacterium]
MRILIFDHDLESAQLASQTLHDAGHESKCVSSKSQCFRELGADRYDLMLANADMPNGSILLLIEDLKQKGISLPIVVFAKPGSEKKALNAINDGAYDYIIRDANGSYRILLPPVVEEAHRKELIVQENMRYRDELSYDDPLSFSPSTLMNIRYRDELKRLNRQLASRTIYDSLTGLYNRRQMELDLVTQLNFTERYDSPLTCLILAINHLPDINDTYGHGVGDVIIRELGQILLKTRRKTDSCYRHAGNQFLILMPHTSFARAETFADRLCQQIHHHAFQVDKLSLQIAVSVGLAAYERDKVNTPDLLLECAHDALYRNGGDSV